MIYVIGRGWVVGEHISEGDYFLEIVQPTLFDKGYARLYKYAHPDSLSCNHLLEEVEYEKREELKWTFKQLTDPVETVYGDF